MTTDLKETPATQSNGSATLKDELGSVQAGNVAIAPASRDVY